MTTCFIHVYRPQILALTGDPSSRPALVDFAHSVTRGLGLLICGHAAQGPISQRARSAFTQKSNEWLLMRKVKGFYSLSEDVSFSRAVRSMIQVSIHTHHPLMAFFSCHIISTHDNLIFLT